MGNGWLWLCALAAPPMVVIAATWSGAHVERIRRIAVGSGLALVAIAGGGLLGPGGHEVSIAWGRPMAPAWGEAALRVDGVSGALLPFAALLWLLAIAVTPRRALDRGGLRRTALATLLTLASFVTSSPLLLLGLWVGSVLVLVAGLPGPGHRAARRVAVAYLGGSVALFAAGVTLAGIPAARGTAWEQVGLALVGAAVLVRGGVLPFHAWIPEVFDRGRLGPATLFCAPQVGSWVAVAVLLPRAADVTLQAIAVLALLTAVYGAALAVVQRDARRVAGYLFASQSSLVVAGLVCPDPNARTGALVLWLSSGVAFAGLGRGLLALEVRRGRLDLDRWHGGYEQMPIVALSFLVMGLACAGFPGTLGFVGHELLLDGMVHAFPVLGLVAVVSAAALTGLTVVRAYFAMFCGRRDAPLHMKATPREIAVFGALIVMLVGAGLAPGALIRSRADAAAEIDGARRAARGGGDAGAVEPAAVELRHGRTVPL